ncbi:hypothetical protein C8R46DRAFT_1221872 [Mycena filopes]|nr:hypothetical protein C8R46DRAFT_1221872 [Mycena filopes]
MSHSTPSSIPPSTPPSLAEDPGASSRGVQGDGASAVAGAPATPPRKDAAAASASVKATPRVQKPGNTALATTATALKQDAVFTFYMWKQMLQNNFAGMVDVDEFLKEFMPPAADEGSVIAGIVEKSQTHLDAVKAVLKPKTEDDDAEKIVAYFNAIAQDFPAPRRPVVADTHKVTFKSIDGAHETKPDITSSRPGLTYIA